MTLQSIKVFSIRAIELSYPYSSPVQYLFKDVDSVGQDVSSVFSMGLFMTSSVLRFGLERDRCGFAVRQTWGSNPDCATYLLCDFGIITPLLSTSVASFVKWRLRILIM